MTVLTVIFIILAVIGFIIGISAKMGAFGGSESEKAEDKKLGTMFLIGGILLAGAAFVTSSVQIVEANHVGIPVFMGSIGDELKPGLHFVNPFSDIHVF